MNRCKYTTLAKTALLLLIPLFLLSSSCSLLNKKDQGENTQSPNQEKKKRINPNALERIDSYEGGILFGKKKNTDFEGKSILWVATMDTIGFMPISSASYNGGLIITDWYNSNGSKDSIKFQIKFLSSEIKNSSIEVSSFKRVCDKFGNCKIKESDNNLNIKLKDQIFAKVRKFEIDKVSKN